MIETFSKLEKSELDALDITTWSKRLPNNAPNIWGIMCSHLKLKDNDKNKKWLAYIWQNNVWFVTEEVRK